MKKPFKPGDMVRVYGFGTPDGTWCFDDEIVEAQELECEGEECEIHCALVDVAENVRLSASRIARVGADLASGETERGE